MLSVILLSGKCSVPELAQRGFQRPPKCPIMTAYAIKPMDYETEIINGRKLVVRHFFEPYEIQVGSCWFPNLAKDAPKGYVTVEGFNSYEGLNPYGSTDPWYEVVYSWEENGVRKTDEKDLHYFQSRYSLIVEDT